MLKTKKVYLYLTQLTKDEMGRLHNIHKLSISTICNIIINNIYCFCKNKPDVTTFYKIKQTAKLCIKPRLDHGTKDLPNYIYRNCIEYYMAQLTLNEKDQDKEFKQAINNINIEFKTTKDRRWQYNQQLRDTTRLVKQNRTYFKKILGE